MTLFVNKTADDLSTKLNELVDNFSKKLLSYNSPIDLAQKREAIPNALMLAGGLIATVGIPAGMMVGKYFNEMATGVGLAAIIPAGMMIGAGLITYLNHVANKEYVNNMDVDLPEKAKHNEMHGNDFLKKLEGLNIGDSFKEIKSIVDDSIKNPKEPQENAIIRIKSTIKKNNLE
jgi:F0F1-type ATP synthase assembly protein I